MSQDKGRFKRIFPSRDLRAARKRMKQDQALADEHFTSGPEARCLDCSSHHVRVGTADSIPHGCGEPLHFDEKTREHGSISRVRWAYYDNTGVIVRTETKPMYP